MPSWLRAAAGYGAAILPVFWAGMIVGVSFIATPIKFTAPELSLPAAIDVGRVTFVFANRVEWGLAAVSALAVFAGPAGRPVLVGFAAVCAVLLVQTFWLLPVLEARSIAYVAGEPLPPSAHHRLFGIAEIAKLALLLLISGLAIRAGRTR